MIASQETLYEKQAKYILELTQARQTKAAIKEIEDLIKKLGENNITIYSWLYSSGILSFILKNNDDISESQQIEKHSQKFIQIFRTLVFHFRNVKYKQKIREIQEKLKQNSKIKKILEQQIIVEESEDSIKKRQLLEMALNSDGEKEWEEREEEPTQYKDIFEEIFYNWIKDIKQKKVKGKGKDPCCRKIFFLNEEMKVSSNEIFEFKKYKMPFQANKMRDFHFLKVMTGFMNHKGGILFVGASCKGETTKFEGFPIKNNKYEQLRKLKQYFEKLCQRIFPKHKALKLQHKKQQNIADKSLKLTINSYISLQPIELIHECKPIQIEKQKQSQTLSYAGSKNYMIKLNVKPGHPKHLYHLFHEQNKDEDNFPQFFIRNNNKSENLKFEQAYEKIYEKLQAFEDAQYSDNEEARNKLLPQKFHPNCLFNVSMKVDFDASFDLEDDQ